MTESLLRLADGAVYDMNRKSKNAFKLDTLNLSYTRIGCSVHSLDVRHRQRC